MSLPTLYAPRIGAARSGDEIELPESERAHLHALRLGRDDRVEVTDGRGRRWVADLTHLGSRARCALVEPAEAAPDVAAALAFGVAAKDRTLWLVEKAVELGVRGLQPLELARSRSVADAGRSPGFWDKTRRRAVAALKQCGGARMPDIGPVLPLDRWLADGAPAPGLAAAGPLGLLAAPEAPRTLLDLATARWSEGGALLLVGPEGGLTPREVEGCLDAGFEAVSLGPRTLRFETAAVAGLALLAQLELGRRVATGKAER